MKHCMVFELTGAVHLVMKHLYYVCNFYEQCL